LITFCSSWNYKHKVSILDIHQVGQTVGRSGHLD
jgi:hypothetical protein